MAWKSVSSTLSQISPRLGCSFEWNPAFRLLHMNDTSRCSIGVCICWAPPSGRSICKLCDDGCPEYGLNAVIAHSLWIGDFHGVQRLFVWYYSSETGDITVKFSVNVTSNTSREEFLRKLAQCPPVQWGLSWCGHLIWSRPSRFFLQLKLILFLLAHSSTLFSSWTRLSNIGGRNAQVDVIGEFKHSG